MTETKPGLDCPGCGEFLSPLKEAKDFPDATYTETCPYCYKDYSDIVKDGKVSLWEAPKNTSQKYNGTGKPGGSDGR